MATLAGKIGKFAGRTAKNIAINTAIGAAAGYAFDKFAAPAIEKKMSSYFESKVNSFDMGDILNGNVDNIKLENIVNNSTVDALKNPSSIKSKVTNELGSQAQDSANKISEGLQSKSDSMIKSMTSDLGNLPDSMMGSFNIDSITKQYEGLINQTDNSQYKDVYASLKDYYENQKSNYSGKADTIINNVKSKFEGVDINTGTDLMNKYSGSIGKTIDEFTSSINKDMSTKLDDVNKSMSNIQTNLMSYDENA